MFIDEAVITVKAGDGGNGCISFRREKYVPKGGPDGGDGGNGGSIVLVASNDLQTLLDFKFNRIFKSEDGEHGLGSKMHGKNGRELQIKVPVGTQVCNAKNGKLIYDLAQPGESFVIMKGGRGGRGNTHFTSAVRHAPRYCELGEEGAELEIRLVLKLIADIGLVGFPNAGKSTILSKISKATPKIANYPFTTLSPNLGVTRIDYDKVMVVADIPGIIEGAHEGAGLGNQFLKHIERTRAIVYVIDMTGFERPDPAEDLKTLQKELKAYSKKLAGLPFIIAANKMDIPDSNDHYENFTKKIKRLKAFKDIKIFKISGLSGLNLDKLIRLMYDLKLFSEESAAREAAALESGREVLIDSSTAIEAGQLGTTFAELGKKTAPRRKPVSVKVNVLSPNEYQIVSEQFEADVKRVNFKADDALYYFRQLLKKYMVDKALRKAGARNGDTVYIKDFAFDYQDE
ncbi:MAG: hypothetical protein A2008_12780 [Candidatus Wallbacteria bacterium GWC2_49_35]|uniref:GTPase Obg n=1 Tax=Candidatus Wallbacteria bacterium GWC2_49_35 TaxID=1817813 RepID=A0A1F7WH88_9BACT|nr:MAG: hypothetical protein A2008_12780 [Candidatus Wallbacteria bacterium GWC2_49_35]HBC75772.1 hypothetical protein [Candidatus Wallbacteria bacterium]